MFRTLLATIAFLLPAFVFAGDLESDFQKAVAASGAEYVPLRDSLVKSAADDFLKKKAESENLQEKVVAQSILAWKEHGKTYSERLDANLFVSKPGNLLFDWANDRSITGDPVMIPLAIEMLIKNTAGEPGVFGGVRIIAATGRSRTFKDEDILFAYLAEMPPFEAGIAKLSDKAKTAVSNVGGDPEKRPKIDSAEAVAQAIAGLPADTALSKRISELLYRIGKDSNSQQASDNVRKADAARVSTIAKVLTISFVRAAQGMSPAEKKELMTALTSEKELLGAVGPEPTLNAAGLIGGPEAAAALLKYLREATTDSVDNEKIASVNWAFQLLRRMRDESGPARLRDYALDSKMPAAGRETALENLAGTRYSDDLLTAVSSILEDSSAPTSVRFAALRTLDQLFRANQGREEITGPLRKAILETSFEPQDEDYGGPAKQIKDIVRETP